MWFILLVKCKPTTPTVDKYAKEKKEIDSLQTNIFLLKEGQRILTSNVNKQVIVIDSLEEEIIITENKIELIRKISSKAYPELKKKYEGQFDFIYIDGDHRELAVYEDAVNCFDLCKTNGYILFDDYLWKDFSDEQVTKKGVDKFVSEYSEKIEVILDGNQFLIKKK